MTAPSVPKVWPGPRIPHIRTETPFILKQWGKCSVSFVPPVRDAFRLHLKLEFFPPNFHPSIFLYPPFHFPCGRLFCIWPSCKVLDKVSAPLCWLARPKCVLNSQAPHPSSLPQKSYRNEDRLCSQLYRAEWNLISSAFDKVY